ncbi:MAG: hypothetical protein IJ215_03150 [Clostridia bacterium]|nr:hypothetical protein [Clostridia bacterium]
MATSTFPEEVKDIRSFTCWLRLNQVYVESELSQLDSPIPKSRREKAKLFVKCLRRNGRCSDEKNPLERIFEQDGGYFDKNLEWLKAYLSEELKYCTSFISALEDSNTKNNEAYRQMDHIGNFSSVSDTCRNWILATNGVISSFRNTKKDIEILLRVLEEGQHYVDSLYIEKTCAA